MRSFRLKKPGSKQPRRRSSIFLLTELHPFKNHPFKVTDDESMLETAESITKHGVLVPVIARPREEGGYELISGHRRKRASELAGKETLPCIVRNLDDDAATIIMVDSNIQRENILPSERAFAYKLKLEAMKRQGKTAKDLTSAPSWHEVRELIEILAEQVLAKVATSPTIYPPDRARP